jgi:GYF domain 2
MQLHVARNGQQLGQFSLEEVHRKLVDGTFSPTDLGWHEGAAGWAMLSRIAGVTIPTQSAAPTPPPPPPILPPMPSAPPPQPIQGSVVRSAPQPIQSYKGMAVTSWILLGLTALLSIVPVLGFAAWFLALAVVPVALILGIIILTRGGKTQGMLILVTSVVILPAFILVASLASTLILGAAVSEREKTQEKQIIENLRALSEAKAKWVRQTRVTDGTKVTVAGLTAYLDGKEIKAIVGETYDPRPVGEEPTATLPLTKSLASHEKGAVITASGSSLVPNTSSSADSRTDDEVFSPTATPQVL